ncbi:Rieske 2Fe-2S domain-containing protein [bacterium]|nr:Rieske 2Fe-2S domain-containing protein [bacterium]MCI0615512.1 Rieske 2Fe-2S domain-containing protein [bacterium]
MDEQPQWRKDFPIETGQDEYVSRRDFTKYVVLVSLAFVIGQFWIMVLNWNRRRRGELPLTEVATIDELRTGETKLFQYPKQHEPCVLVRVNDSQFVAYSQKCTHLSCPVIPKPELGKLNCPCHEGSFDLASGQPIAGPPRRPLIKVKLRFQNGRIYAAGLENA